MVQVGICAIADCIDMNKSQLKIAIKTVEKSLDKTMSKNNMHINNFRSDTQELNETNT